MTIAGIANEPRYVFEIGGMEFLVVDFKAREKISKPFQVALTLASEEEVDFESVMGRTGLLTLEILAEERFFNGMINEFEQIGASGRFFLYNASLVPMIWLLSMEKDCRIFQNKSVRDIIKQVFSEAGITTNLYDFRLQGSYSPRTYCVQYRETDLNFISRLLEEEGIFYFFEHSKDRHLMIFGDSNITYQPIEGEKAIMYNPTGGMVGEEAVYRFKKSCKIRSGKYTHQDYNFKKPSLNLVTEDKADEYEKLEVYDYPGIYEETGTGSKLAKVRLQEARMHGDTAEGESICFRFVPGFTFELTEHDIKSFNREYLLIEVEQKGTQPQVLGERANTGDGFGYHNTFSSVPSGVTIRPERKTPKPVMDGVQTAIVTGPPGEEIYPDEHGRVKVKFHWDRENNNDENSSCWIRVSQLWAGAGWGAMAIPRIGQEVIVDFIEGDPDYPIITGRVYHGTNTPPYGLPADKTKTTIKSDSSLGGGGSNEIRFEDLKGREEIYVHGQKDWNIIIENDKNQTVGHDETHKIGNDLTVAVGHDEVYTIGNNQTHQVVNNRSRTVGNNESIRIGSNKSEIVTIASTETVGAAKTLTVGGAFQISVGAAMNATIGGLKASQVVGAVVENVGSKKTVKIGGSDALDVGKSQTINISDNMNHTVGGKRTDSVKKEYTLKAKKVTIQAKDEIVLVSGGSRIILKKNGEISLKGKKINMKASGKILFKASQIVEN